ncbi:MAG TPA: DUF1499 domain-containing protein [Longimicrobiales bacterium]|nr:DUF1499 domain-containing protein [Longimicrobiales bacterium]
MTRSRRRGHSETSRSSEEPYLRGRTLAIPFEDVWSAAHALAAGGLRRWTVDSADDTEGVIHATSRSLRGIEHDVVIRVSLDSNAQTRVDASATARKPGMDFGAASRRVRRFFHALDNALARTPRRGTAHRPS